MITINIVLITLGLSLIFGIILAMIMIFFYKRRLKKRLKKEIAEKTLILDIMKKGVEDNERIQQRLLHQNEANVRGEGKEKDQQTIESSRRAYLPAQNEARDTQTRYESRGEAREEQWDFEASTRERRIKEENRDIPISGKFERSADIQSRTSKYSSSDSPKPKRRIKLHKPSDI
jgi:hypothetical protein